MNRWSIEVQVISVRISSRHSSHNPTQPPPNCIKCFFFCCIVFNCYIRDFGLTIQLLTIPLYSVLVLVLCLGSIDVQSIQGSYPTLRESQARYLGTYRGAFVPSVLATPETGRAACVIWGSAQSAPWRTGSTLPSISSTNPIIQPRLRLFLVHIHIPIII